MELILTHYVRFKTININSKILVIKNTDIQSSMNENLYKDLKEIIINLNLKQIKKACNGGNGFLRRYIENNNLSIKDVNYIKKNTFQLFCDSINTSETYLDIIILDNNITMRNLKNLIIQISQDKNKAKNIWQYKFFYIPYSEIRFSKIYDKFN